MKELVASQNFSLLKILPSFSSGNRGASLQKYR